MEEQLQSGV